MEVYFKHRNAILIKEGTKLLHMIALPPCDETRIDIINVYKGNLYNYRGLVVVTIDGNRFLYFDNKMIAHYEKR